MTGIGPVQGEMVIPPTDNSKKDPIYSGIRRLPLAPTEMWYLP